jgi:pimeloyl-ACP methyl ester carboxylesterase
MATVTIAGGRTIHYDDAGAGPVLLIITGLGQPRWVSAERITAFSPMFRVIAVDNRDAGDSPPESAPYSIADLADDVAGMLATLGIERAHVLGESMGGFIALELALRHPEMIDRLVLVSTAPAGVSAAPSAPLVPSRDGWIDDPVERWRAALPRAVAPGFFDTRPKLLDRLAETFRGNRQTWEGRARQFAAQERFDARDRLGAITAPTLIVHGDLDPLLPPSGARQLAEGIPGAQLMVVPGAGHVLRSERPDDVNRATRVFLTAR